MDEEIQAQRTSITIGVYLALGINGFGMFVFLTVMPYVSEAVGLDPTSLQYGYLHSAHAFLQMLLAPALGRFADITGKKTLLLINCAALSAAHVMLGASRGVVMLATAQFTSLLFDTVPGAQMVIADIVPEKDRSGALGQVLLPFMAGFIFGPMAAGLLVANIGAHDSMGITWVLGVMSALVVIYYIPRDTKLITEKKKSDERTDKSSEDGKESLLSTLLRGDILYILFVKTVLSIPQNVLITNFGILTMKQFSLPPEQNGLIGAYIGTCAVVVNGFGVKLLNKYFNEGQLARACAVLNGVCYLCMAYSTSLLPVLVAFFPTLLTFTVIDIQCMSRLTNASQEHTGSMIGVCSASFHATMILAPVLGTALMGSHGLFGLCLPGVILSPLLAGCVFTKW